MYKLQICLLERLKIKEPSRKPKKLEKGTAGHMQKKQNKTKQKTNKQKEEKYGLKINKIGKKVNGEH